MADISAAAVKRLRERTDLPMMKCKQALQETGGDEEAAVEWLRKELGVKMTSRSGERTTQEGRVFCLGDVSAGYGAMIELLCETAPVASHEDFRALGADLLQQLISGPGASTGEELLAQDCPSKPGQTLQDVLTDLSNKMGEVFRIPRLLRVDGPCGFYAHHTGTDGVLIEVSGGSQQPANEIAMHTAAMKPQVIDRDSLPQEDVEKEREFQKDLARQEGKPENIIEKMIEGRMRLFYEQRCLVDQKFVKDESGKKTVGQFAKENKMELKRMEHWKLGQTQPATESTED